MKKLILMLGLVPMLVGAQPFGGGGPYPIGTKPVTIMVYTNGTATGPNGAIYTGGTRTCGIQEAINALQHSTKTDVPGGGVVELGTGAYYTLTNIYVTNGFGFGLTIKGPGENVGGITYAGTNQGGLSVIKFAENGTDRNSVYLHDLWFSATTNATTNLVYISSGYGRVKIDHCWFAPWKAMTNNPVFNSDLTGLSTATQGTFNTGNTPNLVGVVIEGLGDQVIINGCNFMSLACGVDDRADHAVISGCEFSYIGSSAVNGWSTNGVWPYCLKPAISVSSTVSGLCSQNNFFYQCQACYLVTGANRGSVSAIDDQYESSTRNFLLSPDCRILQYAMNSRGARPADSLISTVPWGQVAGLEPYRIFRLDLQPLFTTLTVRSNSSQALWNGGITLGSGSLDFDKGTLLSLTCVDSPTNGVNVTYTSILSYLPGTTLFTNATTGFYIVIDPTFMTGLGDSVTLYNAAQTPLYAFLGPNDGEDGIIWEYDEVVTQSGGSTATGSPQMFATYTNASTIAYLNGAGVTNIPAPTIVVTNLIDGKPYVNGYGRPIYVSATPVLTTAAVNGDAALHLECSGTLTNRSATGTTVAVSLAQTYTNTPLSVIVPVGSSYWFTNKSTGAGNVGTIIGGQILVY